MIGGEEVGKLLCEASVLLAQNGLRRCDKPDARACVCVRACVHANILSTVVAHGAAAAVRWRVVCVCVRLCTRTRGAETRAASLQLAVRPRFAFKSTTTLPPYHYTPALRWARRLVG
jgi:hypothetical protein